MSTNRDGLGSTEPRGESTGKWGRLAPRWIAAGIFIFAGLAKAVHPQAAVDAIASLGWVPLSWSVPSAAALVVGELLVGVCLLGRRTAVAGSALGALAATGFLGANLGSLVSGRPDDCPCFGVFLKLPTPAMLLLDLFVLAVTLQGIIAAVQHRRGGKAIPSPASSLGPPSQGTTVGPAGASRVHGSRGLRVPALCSLLALSLFVFSKVLPNDPLLQTAVAAALAGGSEAQRRAAIEGIRQRDPAVGDTLPLPRPDVLATEVSASLVPSGEARMQQRRILLLLIGECSTCALPIIREAIDATRARPDVRLLVVSSSPAAELRYVWKQFRLAADAASDPTDRLRTRYNAAWVPRAYLLSSSAQLIWCQPDRFPDFGAIPQPPTPEGQEQ